MTTTEGNPEYSGPRLWRILLALNILLLISAVVMVILVASSGAFESSWTNTRYVLLLVATIVCFVNAFVVFLVGWFRTVYWYWKMLRSTLPDVKFYRPIRNPANAIFFPSYLTKSGQIHRLRLFAALKVLGLGAILILMTFGLEYLSKLHDAV